MLRLRNGSEITSAVPSPPWGEGRVRGKRDTVVIYEPFLRSLQLVYSQLLLAWLSHGA